MNMLGYMSVLGVLVDRVHPLARQWTYERASIKPYILDDLDALARDQVMLLLSHTCMQAHVHTHALMNSHTGQQQGLGDPGLSVQKQPSSRGGA